MEKIKQKYNFSKSAKVNTECICPSCGNKFIKDNYQQAFCKSRSGTKCKDKYWNTVTPEKRNNTTRISPASLNWLANKEMNRKRSAEHLRPMNTLAIGKYQGRTSEGYRIFGGIAFNDFDGAVYNVDVGEDDYDHGQWND